jgi:peptidoglycan-N-acetylglucosamine deacetylase
MSWKNVSARAGKRWPATYLVAGLATGLALLWLVYRVFLTIPVSIDGTEMRLMAGTTVADLFSSGRVHGKHGDLVAAGNHRILKRGAGEAPYLVVGGKRVSAEDRLYASDVVRTMNGSDTLEPVVKRMEPLPAPVRYEGHGSLESVVSSGAPGLQEVTFGVLSKQVVSKRVVRAPVSQLVRRAEPGAGGKVVALTFDDGPWPGQTEAILKILQKYQIKATFFEIGAQAKGRPGLSKMLADAGMQMGNHTEDHLNLKHLDAAHVAREIQQGEANIAKASGQQPRFFRPPGGNINPSMWPVLSQLNTKMVMWDIDTEDWKKPPPATIVSRVLGGVRPGAVVLMHDGGGDRSHTIAALPTIIEKLKALGYQFVTLDALSTLPQKMG